MATVKCLALLLVIFALCIERHGVDANCDQFSIGDPEKREFYSPGYPRNYPHNMNCELQLTAPIGYTLRVEFHTFILEGGANCMYDSLEIRDGNSNTSPYIGIYCGDNRPPVITSRGRQLYLIFRSDGSNTFGGFLASYTYQMNTKCENFSVGNPEKKEFYSPFYPSAYENNMHCELQLTAPSGYIIRIEFHEFHLEPSSSCSLDHLDISEGNSTHNSFIGEYCGISGPQPITSKGRYLYLRFKSDAANTYPGFRASYEFLENVDCEKFSKGDPQKMEFYSPLYPSNYDNNMNCDLQLTAPFGYMIRVEFHEFHLQATRGCSSDYVRINEGNDSNNTLIGQYCGSSGPQPITSQGRYLFLSFKSDSSNTFPGFRASYQFVTDDRCQKFSIGDPEKKEFYSPYYPLEYHNNMNCEKQLTAPAGHVIRINFHEFNLVASPGCNLDYLQINEGNSTSHTLVGEYCGKSGPQAIISEGRELFLKFKSGGSLTATGFRASYQFLEEDESFSMKRLLPRYRKHPRRN